LAALSGRVAPRKGLTVSGLAALIRRGLPLAGGSSRKNEPVSFSEASKGPPDLGLLDADRVDFLV